MAPNLCSDCAPTSPGKTTEGKKKNASFALETPAASADESTGWFSWLLGPRRESGAKADAEASKPKIKQAAGEAASIEFLGRWYDNIDDLAMPVKFKVHEGYNDVDGIRVAFSRFIDDLVRERRRAAFSR